VRGPPLPSPLFRTGPEALAVAAASYDGALFVEEGERERFFAWRELRERARATGAALAALGVEPGDRVAIVLGTGPEFFDAFFGAWLAGAVPVPLYPPLRLGRIDEYHAQTARMLEQVGARVLITDGRIQRLLGRLVERARPPLGCRIAAELREAPGAAVEVAPDSLALIQFSSGTTVAPKPVAITHAALMAQLAAVHTLLPHTPELVHRGVLWLPLYHDLGLVGSLLGIYYPGTVVLLRPERFLARPSLWLRAIARHRATLSAAPNFAYALCVTRVRDEELRGADLSSWRIAINGAETISPRVARRFVERFAPFGLRRGVLMPAYGLSEATAGVTHAEPNAPLVTRALGRRELVCVGRPWPGVEVEVRDDAGRAPERTIGRIFVRGPSVMRGYFGNSDATRRALDGGWLDTGDLGLVDGGQLYLCGRAKDVVIVRGQNHAPEEFEECLEGVRGVRAGCAIAVGIDGVDGERLLMLVERSGSADPTLSERVRALVLERTGVAPEVRVLEPGTLPRTSSGKRRRGEALRRHLAGELRAPPRVTRARVLVEVVRSALAFARLPRGRHSERS
jgi:acyl-CoA synthetase (AMP-forming)/AMP-acid ligase II